MPPSPSGRPSLGLLHTRTELSIQCGMPTTTTPPRFLITPSMRSEDGHLLMQSSMPEPRVHAVPVSIKIILQTGLNQDFNFR